MLQGEEPGRVVPQVRLRQSAEPVVREESVGDDGESHANRVGYAVRAARRAPRASPRRPVAVVPHRDDTPQVLPPAHVQRGHRGVLRVVDAPEVCPEERVRLVQVLYKLPDERRVGREGNFPPAQVQHVAQRVQPEHRGPPVQVPKLRGLFQEPRGGVPECHVLVESRHRQRRAPVEQHAHLLKNTTSYQLPIRVRALK